MDLTNRVFRHTDSILHRDIMVEANIVKCKRVITIFTKSKIDEHNRNIIEDIYCLITNYSVSKFDEITHYNKTIYVCKTSSDVSCLEICEEDQLYSYLAKTELSILFAVSSSDVIKNGKYFNFGTTYVDLIEVGSMSAMTLGVDKNVEPELYDSTIKRHIWDPIYYTYRHAQLFKDENEFGVKRCLNDYIDKNTQVVISKVKKQIIIEEHNNRTEFIITKTLIDFSKFIYRFFSSFSVMLLEDLEIVYDTRAQDTKYTIKKLNVFERVCDEKIENIVDKVISTIEQKVLKFYGNKKRDFYFSFNFNSQQMDSMIYFYDTDTRYSVCTPLFMMYEELMFDFDKKLSDIEYSAESVVDSHLDTMIKRLSSAITGTVPVVYDMIQSRKQSELMELGEYNQKLIEF